MNLLAAFFNVYYIAEKKVTKKQYCDGIPACNFLKKLQTEILSSYNNS